ncbi:unnamed protein product [Arctogadus glacialis]
MEGDPAEARSAVLGCNISPIRKHDPLDYMYSGPPFYTEFERLLSHFARGGLPDQQACISSDEQQTEQSVNTAQHGISAAFKLLRCT